MSGRTYRTAGISLSLSLTLAAAPLVSQEQPVRARETGTHLEVQVLRIARELAAQRRLEVELNRTLSAILVSAEKDAKEQVRWEGSQAARSLRSQLETTVATQLKLRRELEAVCSAGEKPRGWFGVALQGDVTVSRQSDGANVFRYGEHQRVVTVEPGSPADKAGIRAQDVIIAIGGRDLRAGEVIASELLRPGAKVPVTLVRSGDRQNLMVYVEERPESFEMTCPWIDPTIARAIAPSPAPSGFRFTVLPDSARRLFVRPSRVGAGASPAPSAARGAEPGNEPPVVYSGSMFRTYASTDIVAGAQLIVMNKDLGQNFGVDEGLLVVQAFPGTPAQVAGLRGGDVLLRANDLRLTSPRSLARIINVSPGEVKLTILRSKQQQVVTMKW